MRLLVVGLGTVLFLLITGCGDDVTGPGEPPAADPPDDPAPSVTADAGPDASEFVGFTATLDGSGSTGSSSLSYSWEVTDQPDGSEAILQQTSSATPDFMPDLPGSYTFTLTATVDDASDSDDVTVSAIAKRLFVDANAGDDSAPNGYLPTRPVQSITRALNIAGLNATDAFHAVDTVRVAPGRYDAANGETFPMTVQAELLLEGNDPANREAVHLLSPDVDRDPALILNDGVTLRHMLVENGYTGTDPSGDPDVLYINDGASIETSLVQISSVTVRSSNPGGYMLTAGSDIRVAIEGTAAEPSIFDGQGIAPAYSTRFNTSNTAVAFDNIEFRDMGAEGTRGAIRVGNTSSNHRVRVSSSTIHPGPAVENPGIAFNLRADGSTLDLEDVLITSSDGTPSGNRFNRGLNMGNDQPASVVSINNSEVQFIARTGVLIRESTWTITNTRFAGINTQNPGDITFLSKGAIELLDGALTLRGNTFEDINGTGLLIKGPEAPNTEGYIVDLGTVDAPGGNNFSAMIGWDLHDARNEDRDVVGEMSAVGNTWSVGGTPRCGETQQEPEEAEIFVNDEGNSVRWGSESTQVCAD